MTDKKLSEEFVKRSVIQYLSKNGWGHFQFGGLREHGVDIRARHSRYSRYFLIEVKGEGSSPQMNENYFVYSLGQIVTRMTASGTTRTYYGLALPEAVAKIAKRRIPWQVAKKLLLYVFVIDAKGNVEQLSWKELKNAQ
ncbi:MAG: hypothetical protein A3D67_01830 [Candidatus Lloydbacteria bacterium RIFCSPHIGHO2_02_FULL_51_22]|uniref:Uncharacterized protein n=2 Tax=Candidatus Lloydiibacteriota TaxID=1817910 RepID=A0A1G2DBE7_9BACT|nr:MAG: hypothetical protein A3D67_01830 [Candidatus Lloydbacteria bacterium RIFCSPHIGHO2_02_FULL_51_22]OGZ14602.1 MAG: hypothetical protein A3J08_03285 [Candidatus Lloydbacteria bacterium RIFCSPLOWO2_02_FULL_51_11]